MAPAGIINFGNSCFLNSTLQALLSIESLHDVLSSWPLSNDHMSLTQSLLALNNKTDHENMSVRRLLHDLPVVYGMHRRSREQCDAEECLTHLLNGMEEEFGCHVVDEMFGGLLKQNRVCPSCSLSSFAPLTKFNILSLSMSHEPTSLSARIAEFHGDEVLEASTTCGRCGKHSVGAIISDEVSNWPHTLILQLKRFGSTSAGAVKEFDEVVDFEEEMHLGHVYQLRSVVVHEGRFANRGHYFAYVKRGERWFRVSDMSVRVVLFEEVKSCAGYLFLYESLVHGREGSHVLDFQLDGVGGRVEHDAVPSMDEGEPQRRRPSIYLLPELLPVFNEPLFPIDFWQSGTELLTNHHISAALLTLLPDSLLHKSRSIPRHPNFVAPISIQNFARVVEQASVMICNGQVPEQILRRIDDPQLKCLIAAAHGTMNPTFVIGDDIHWRVMCLDSSRRVIYTVDPYGTRTGFFLTLCRKQL